MVVVRGLLSGCKGMCQYPLETSSFEKYFDLERLLELGEGHRGRVLHPSLVSGVVEDPAESLPAQEGEGEGYLRVVPKLLVPCSGEVDCDEVHLQSSSPGSNVLWLVSWAVLEGGGLYHGHGSWAARGLDRSIHGEGFLLGRPRLQVPLTGVATVVSLLG